VPFESQEKGKKEEKKRRESLRARKTATPSGGEVCFTKDWRRGGREKLGSQKEFIVMSSTRLSRRETEGRTPKGGGEKRGRIARKKEKGNEPAPGEPGRPRGGGKKKRSQRTKKMRRGEKKYKKPGTIWCQKIFVTGGRGLIALESRAHSREFPPVGRQKNKNISHKGNNPFLIFAVFEFSQRNRRCLGLVENKGSGSSVCPGCPYGRTFVAGRNGRGEKNPVA